MSEIKRKRKYRKAPPKSRTAKFFTSFFLTFAILGSLILFTVAYVNSQNLGWGKSAEVFSVINDGENFGFTFLNSDYLLDNNVRKGTDNAINKAKQMYLYLEPAPMRLFGRGCEKAYEYTQSAFEEIKKSGGIFTSFQKFGFLWYN